METPINYPDELPAPLWAQNQNAVVSPNRRTNMTSGRARQRMLFDSVPVMRSASWVMTPGQARLFELWYKNTLKNGTEWFNMKLRNPLGFVSVVCRIANVYQGANSFGAQHWQFSAAIEVWERPLMPDGWEVVPGFVTHSDIFDIAMNRYWPEA